MSALAERANGQAKDGRFAIRDKGPRTLDAYGRLEALCDPGSLHVIRSTVLPRRESKRTRPGDGVIGAAGTVGGSPVYAYAQDQSFVGGALGEAHADTIIRVMEMAERAGAPVVGFIASGGARMDDGIAALGGYGRIFRQNVRLSGKVPQISVISGVSAGGGSYSPALTDFVVMTEGSAMFLTGPGVVREVMGEEIDSDGLGGSRVHSKNGVCQFEAHDDLDAVNLVRELLYYLPQRAGEAPSHAGPADVPGTPPDTIVPSEQRQVYDVRGVIAALVDGGHLLEVSSRWARNMVTAFARIDGRAVGVIANQPWYLGGVIDAEAAQKAAKFVRTCNSFGLPLVVLVDTPGLPAGNQAGGTRCDPPWGQAPARLLGGRGAQADRGTAQGLRRRLHLHELEGPRRGPGSGLARRRDRNHGPQAGRQCRSQARSRRVGRRRGRPRPARRRVRGRARVGRGRGEHRLHRRAG